MFHTTKLQAKHTPFAYTCKPLFSLKCVTDCRLKAALRRCDVRDPDEFDEQEYREASRAVGETTYAIVSCCAAGWKFPWGLRVRLCEVMLR